ncbi:MAG: hypothetical protein ACXW3P_07435 [Rhodospirillales bacterium]
MIALAYLIGNRSPACRGDRSSHVLVRSFTRRRGNAARGAPTTTTLIVPFVHQVRAIRV